MSVISHLTIAALRAQVAPVLIKVLPYSEAHKRLLESFGMTNYLSSFDQDLLIRNPDGLQLDYQGACIKRTALFKDDLRELFYHPDRIDLLIEEGIFYWTTF
jgi:hypothetical protein